MNEKEYFLPFSEYPWFKAANISAIANVTLIHHHHLYWQELDIDISTEIFDNPKKYPLTYQKSVSKKSIKRKVKNVVADR